MKELRVAPAPAPADRRSRIADEIFGRTGIDETMIECLVRAFYKKVRDDALLGPIFEKRVADWEHHLGRMCAFWSSIALLSGRYYGRPMDKHLPLPVDGTHFDRWRGLFEETAKEVCPPAAAAHFIERAQRIAESLELGIVGHRGVHLTRGQRYDRPAHEPADPSGKANSGNRTE